jgi:homoserine O-succinyltransferase/O-acetyltransferase
MKRTASGDLTSRETPGGTGDPIVIGLVNNMADAALHTTERQFRDLIAAASDGRAVRLKCYSFPEVSRADVGRAYVNKHYENIDTLWDSTLDGLIVSGAEPRTADLADESYWPVLTRLVDWAEEHTASTIWSCLAAHGAVYHLDGISRTKRPEKISGVFPCSRATEHELVAGMPSRWHMPHSRQNDLSADALNATGYQTLSASSEAGVDMFIRQRKSLFMFVQGHPEYDPLALLREYHRDIGRFLTGKTDIYPQMPRGYFDEEITASLGAFRQRALRTRDIEILGDFPVAGAGGRLAHPWRLPAERIYANWLSHLVAQRACSLGPTHADRTAAVQPR